MEDHLGTDPAQFALKFHGSSLPVAALATQLELLSKASVKLPDWYEARCFFTRKGIEQASSQASLKVKDFGTGQRAIDLTGGTGVDLWHLSKSYHRVDYVEADPVLCHLAGINFRKLARKNISIHLSTAEKFIQSLHSEESYDLIYLDPDRRNASGQRVAAFEDCQPNVLALLPSLVQHLASGGQILIKASPMLDIEEGRRQLLSMAAGVQAEIISVDNEVKEILFRISQKAGEKDTEVICHIIRKNRIHRFQGVPRANPEQDNAGQEKIENDFKDQFIYEADVALYKARLVSTYFRSIRNLFGEMNHPEGYFFSEQCLEELPARIFRVVEQWYFKPRKLKQELKNREIKKIEISRRYFDLAPKLVYQQLGVRPGGKRYLILSRSSTGKRMAFLCERIR